MRWGEEDEETRTELDAILCGNATAIDDASRLGDLRADSLGEPFANVGVHVLGLE